MSTADQIRDLRDQLAAANTRAAHAEGRIDGLERALTIADLAAKLVTAHDDNARLKADLAAAQDELRSCLVRAQTTPAWPQPAGNNGR